MLAPKLLRSLLRYCRHRVRKLRQGGVVESAPQITSPTVADDATLQAIASVINSGGRTALLMGSSALRETALLAAARIAAKSGVKLYGETFHTRMERGAGLSSVERIAYVAEMASVQLKEIDNLILVAWEPKKQDPRPKRNSICMGRC